MGNVFAPSLVLKQSRCENPWRQFIAWGRQSDHHPRVVGAFVSACPAPACWSSLAVSLLRSLKFEIDPLLPALSTDPRLISYGSQISNPQTLRPTDSSLFEFKKYYCKSICVCIYIYIHIYIFDIFDLKKKHPKCRHNVLLGPSWRPKVSRSKELRRTPSGITYGFPSAVVLRRRLFCWWNLLGKKSWRKR